MIPGSLYIMRATISEARQGRRRAPHNRFYHRSPAGGSLTTDLTAAKLMLKTRTSVRPKWKFIGLITGFEPL